MEEERIEKCLEAIGVTLLDFQKVAIKAALAFDDWATGISRMAIIAARGVSKSYTQMSLTYAYHRWLSAPGRVKHLAKHAKKMRVRKKNMRRIYG
jgi:hypothetical protein